MQDRKIEVVLYYILQDWNAFPEECLAPGTSSGVQYLSDANSHFHQERPGGEHHRSEPTCHKLSPTSRSSVVSQQGQLLEKTVQIWPETVAQVVVYVQRTFFNRDWGQMTVS